MYDESHQGGLGGREGEGVPLPSCEPRGHMLIIILIVGSSNSVKKSHDTFVCITFSNVKVKVKDRRVTCLGLMFLKLGSVSGS